MASDAVDGPRPRLTFGRVDVVRVQVGYRAGPELPAYQQFLLDLPIPEAHDDRFTVIDEARVLAELEPVLYVGSSAPRHFSLHQHRWHTSWGASPGVLEIGLLVSTQMETPALVRASRETATGAFRELLAAAGAPEPTPVSRDAAILRARRGAAAVFGVEPDVLSLSAEQHHPAEGSWALLLRGSSGDEYDVLVGVVDGYAGSVEVRHMRRPEVLDAVGSEGPARSAKRR